MYSIASNIDNKKAFLINKSEIRDRIDPIYFKSVNELKIANKTNFKIKNLSEVAEMQRGRFGHRPRNDPKFYGGDYPFIQTGDIVRASNEGGTIQFSQTLNELGLQTSRLFDKPTMVITIAANIGDTAILDFPACFPDSLIGINPKDNNTLNLEYLNVYFKYLKNYLNELAPQAAQKNINYQQLSPTPIVIPPINIQKEIASIYSDAFKLKKEKLKEVKLLLESIDKYLLKQLGIILPQKDNSFSNRIFEIKWSELSGERLDAVSNQSKELQNVLLSGKYSVSKLSRLVNKVKTGSTPHNSLSPYTNEGIPFLRNTNLQNGNLELENIKFIREELAENLTYSYKNDLIVCIAGTVGNSVINDSKIPLAINQNITALEINQSKVNIEFLNYFFNTNLNFELVKRLCSIATIMYLNNTNLLSLNIPIPPLEKQNEIATHISKIRKRAKELELEANNMLKEAKSKIEKMIIG